MQTPKLANLDSSWTLTGGNVAVSQPWLQLYMAACKLLDVALVLPADFLPQFQLYDVISISFVILWTVFRIVCVFHLVLH